MSEFEGFVLLEENFVGIPSNWTRITRTISSLAELKVIEYVLVLTWNWIRNYEEKSPPRLITTKEFKRETGLTAQSVHDGIIRAIKHGFLEVEEDRKDLGRIKRYYSLCFQDSEVLAVEGRETVEIYDRQKTDRHKLTPRRRTKILERDAYRCIECKGWKNLQIDHIVPISQGGKTTPKNLQTLCYNCHLTKTVKERKN